MITAQGGARGAGERALRRRLASAAAAALLLVLGAGCQACSGLAASLGDSAAAMGMTPHPLSAAPQNACASDVMCPCGTFCDPREHQCRPACMVLPGIGAEGCIARNDARCLGVTRQR